MNFRAETSTIEQNIRFRNSKRDLRLGAYSPHLTESEFPTSKAFPIRKNQQNLNSVLHRFLEPCGYRNDSQNRPRTPQKEILKLTSGKARSPIQFWIDFSSVFIRFSSQLLVLSTTALAAFLQKGETQSDRENRGFCD